MFFFQFYDELKPLTIKHMKHGVKADVSKRLCTRGSHQHSLLVPFIQAGCSKRNLVMGHHTHESLLGVHRLCRISLEGMRCFFMGVHSSPYKRRRLQPYSGGHCGLGLWVARLSEFVRCLEFLRAPSGSIDLLIFQNCRGRDDAPVFAALGSFVVTLLLHGDFHLMSLLTVRPSLRPRYPLWHQADFGRKVSSKRSAPFLFFLQPCHLSVRTSLRTYDHTRDQDLSRRHVSRSRNEYVLQVAHNGLVCQTLA